ncbi:hypothetical protein Y032_0531g3028 [Ancylostoma ceylanicum]|uniref:Uncharacterized protein n=1 Tax=Ancylostoma ceylanicum TaxID=53326 RepID=A0A016WT82_9BILA|nr:hypothetical protein Y032_0531g3028 [Ancylostoma ceylanicum]
MDSKGGVIAPEVLNKKFYALDRDRLASDRSLWRTAKSGEVDLRIVGFARDVLTETISKRRGVRTRMAEWIRRRASKTKFDEKGRFESQGI